MAERSVEASPSSAGRLDRKDSNFSALSWLKTAEFLTSHHLPEKQSLPAYSALAAIGEERAHNIRGIMDMDSIDADVERSGIEGVHSQMSEEQRDAHHASLRRLLRAWCVLRPDVGYAQSMNFVASFSLALFGDDESSAFTLFCGLMATLDSQFHAQWPPLIGFHVEVDALVSLLEEFVPALAPPPSSDVAETASLGSPARSSAVSTRSASMSTLAEQASSDPCQPRPRQPSLWARLTGRSTKSDMIKNSSSCGFTGSSMSVACSSDAVGGNASVTAGVTRKVREVLRLWCCRCFLPLWVGMLPVDVVYGAWQLLLSPDADSGFDSPSVANIAIALAVLRRCVDEVLAALKAGEEEEDDGLSAFAVLVNASKTCFVDPETLIRDVSMLGLTSARVVEARAWAWAERSTRVSILSSPTGLHCGEDAKSLSSMLTVERFDTLRFHLTHSSPSQIALPGTRSSALDGAGVMTAPAAVSSSSLPTVDVTTNGERESLSTRVQDATLGRSHLETQAGVSSPDSMHPGHAYGHSEVTLSRALDTRSLSEAMRIALGDIVASKWTRILQFALGPSATTLQVLTALASQVRTGLLERLAIVFELHAGSREARLGVRELQSLTRTLLALSLAADRTEALELEKASAEEMVVEASAVDLGDLSSGPDRRSSLSAMRRASHAKSTARSLGSRSSSAGGLRQMSAGSALLLATSDSSVSSLVYERSGSSFVDERSLASASVSPGTISPTSGRSVSWRASTPGGSQAPRPVSPQMPSPLVRAESRAKSDMRSSWEGGRHPPLEVDVTSAPSVPISSASTKPKDGSDKGVIDSAMCSAACARLRKAIAGVITISRLTRLAELAARLASVLAQMSTEPETSDLLQSPLARPRWR